MIPKNLNVNDTVRFLHIGMPDDIRMRKLHGDYAGAVRLIGQRLEDTNLPQAMKYSLELQKEIIRRLPEEFPYTKEEALSIIREKLPDFEEAEFDMLVDTRKIRWIYVDGEMRIFNRFYSSLVKAYPGFAQRVREVLPGTESAVGGIPLLDHAMEVMKTKGSMTNRIRIRATMKVKDEFFKPGMFIRAHLPIPCACAQQSDIRIEKVFPENAMIDPEDAPQRTICWEENMEDNHEFLVEYSYLHKAVYHDTEHMAGIESTQTFYTQEKAPHILFTPYIKALVEELTEGVTDPLEKARRFYDFITLNMNYTFMPSYFLMENIAETCARDFNGDCGVFALLFLTLCRCAGIPARWESGFAAEPNFIGGHDWVQFYVEPYGWLYADTSFGVSAKRNNNEERRKFYFGNLDPYRMVANSAFMAPFLKAKNHWRADPYDNQVGEMETDDHGLTYSEYIRFKEVLSCEEV